MVSQLILCVILASVLVSQAGPIVVNESPVRLPIVRRMNLTGTTLVKADQARAKFFKTRSQLPKHEFNVTKAKQSKAAKLNAAAAMGVGITNDAVDYTAQARLFTFLRYISLLQCSIRLLSVIRH